MKETIMKKRTVSHKISAVAVGFVVILIGVGIARASVRPAIADRAISRIGICEIPKVGVIQNNISTAIGIGEIRSLIIAGNEIVASTDAEIASEQPEIRTTDRISTIKREIAIVGLDTSIARAQIAVVHPNLSNSRIVRT
jgi:hypothetical protein